MVLLYFYTSARQSTRLMFQKKITRRTDPPAGDKNKDYVNTLLVVAALVATVTFAAGFTIPGGFNSSEPNQGLPTLAGDRKLTYFMVFDILAMQSSIMTIATLIWAQLGDPQCRTNLLYCPNQNLKLLPHTCFIKITKHYKK